MIFYEKLQRYGNKMAVIEDSGYSLTYAELQKEIDTLSDKIPERTLVFSFCKNTIGSVLGYIAFLQNRAVPVLLKQDMESELRQKLIETYEPTYLFIPEMMKEEFADIEPIWNKYGYCLLKTSFDSDIPMDTELGLLLTTSGSTGSPKFVRQSYRNIQSNAEAIAQYLQLNDTEKPITTLPMNYTYGLSIINSHLLVGATLCLTDYSLMQKEFWSFFKECQATSFGGVPYTYEILKKLRFFGMDLPSLRYMTQAGGKLSPKLHKEFAEYALKSGKQFIVMYGQTEATARMAYLPGEKSLEKYGSMGIAIPGGRLWLKDVEGDMITKPNVVGELVYEGPNVTLGYAECKEDLAKGDERKGILETGDMAKMDEEGFFYIVGRKKRFLKIFGNRVNLDEVEGLIKTEFKETDCACAGVDDKLYIFVTAQNTALHVEIKSFLAEKTRIHPSAFSIKQIDAIPKNEAGKTLYIKLESLYDGK